MYNAVTASLNGLSYNLVLESSKWRYTAITTVKTRTRHLLIQDLGINSYFCILYEKVAVRNINIIQTKNSINSPT